MNLLLSLRARLIRSLARKTPLSYGDIPVGYYRCDLLPCDADLQQFLSSHEFDLQSQELLSHLEASYTELSLHEGFPTQPNGGTFWARFDYEPSHAYAAFQLYLEQAESGPRSLAHLLQVLSPESDTALPFISSSQSDYDEEAQLAPQTARPSITVEQLNEWYFIYYWAQRAKAYDIYNEAAYRHIRARRALYSEDRHYKIADQLLEKAVSYISSKAFMEEMTPKTALEAIKLATQLQRISVGLPGTSPYESLPANGSQVQSNFEMTIRQVGQRNETAIVDERGELISDASLAFNNLLEDPLQANAMQEIIIKMSQATYQDPEEDTNIYPHTSPVDRQKIELKSRQHRRDFHIPHSDNSDTLSDILPPDLQEEEGPYQDPHMVLGGGGRAEPLVSPLGSETSNAATLKESRQSRQSKRQDFDDQDFRDDRKVG